MSDTRTDTARAHDDSDLIDSIESEPDAVSTTAGGALARDVGSADQARALTDPDGTTRAAKQNDIDAGVAQPSDRARGGEAG